MHDRLILEVVVDHVDIDHPGDDESVRASIEDTTQEAGWDARVRVVRVEPGGSGA